MGQTVQQLATDMLNLRVRPEDRALFDRAASVRGINRTQFVLDSARQAATQTVLDQTLFECDQEAFARFVARLDEPAAPTQALRDTMTRPAPWR